MIQIKNIHWKNSPFDDLNLLKNLLINAFDKENIIVKLQINPEKDGLIFLNAQDDKLVISKVTNFLPKKDNKHLKSKRLTLKQLQFFYDRMNSLLDEFGLSADIHLLDPKTNQTLQIREDKMYKTWMIVLPKSFPVSESELKGVVV